MADSPQVSRNYDLKPDEVGFAYVLNWMDFLLEKEHDADASYILEWRGFIEKCQSALAVRSETQPKIAHSKTEYKRLKEQGADVLPPTDKNDSLESHVEVRPCAVADHPDAHTTWLVLDHQSFPIGGDYHETKEEAEWYKRMLVGVLRRLPIPSAMQPTVAYQMCSEHQGTWFEMTFTPAAPLKVVCPICEKQRATDRGAQK